MADLEAASKAWESANNALEEAGDQADDALRGREREAWHEMLRVMDPFGGIDQEER